MSKPISSTMRDIEGEKVCEVFGHKARRYGDGIFCENCDLPMEEKDLKPIQIYRNGKSKPEWLRNVQTGLPSVRYKAQKAQREKIIIP